MFLPPSAKKKGPKRCSKVKELRRALGLSTTQMAYRLGLSQSSVVRLEQSEERGRISIASLERMADVLECELVYNLKPRKKNLLKRPNESFGRSRLSLMKDKRTPSSLNESLRKKELKYNKTLTVEQRIDQACNLSDFSRNIFLCSKKP